LIFTVLNSVISLFSIILICVLSDKKDIINSEINNGLINILLMITLTFMILTSFTSIYDDYIKSNVLKAFYYSIIIS